MREDMHYLRHLRVENWKKMLINVKFPENNLIGHFEISPWNESNTFMNYECCNHCNRFFPYQPCFLAKSLVPSLLRTLDVVTQPVLDSLRWYLVPTREPAFAFRVIFITLRPRQKDRHFANDIFKCASLNESFWLSNKISLKYVPYGEIDNTAALFQIMDWHRTGDKPLSEAILVCCIDAYMSHYASVS